MLDSLMNILKYEYEVYKSFSGHSPFLGIYILSLLYLSFAGKTNRVKYVYPSLLIFALIVNPLSFWYVFSRLLGASSWRLFWMLPIVPIIIISIVNLISRFQGKMMRGLFVVIGAMLIVVLGDNIYFEKKQFVYAENLYKLPQESLEVVDCVLSLDDDTRCVVPADLFCYTRQYKSEFKQYYGRDAEGFIAPWWIYKDDDKEFVYENEKAQQRNNSRIVYEQANGCNVIITQEKDVDILTEVGYEKVNSKGLKKSIFYCEDMPVYNWKVVQRGYNGAAERSGYVWIDRNKQALLVIDGGCQGVDNWMINEYVEQNHQIVDTWILTTLNDHHIGIFLDYVEKSNASIKTVIVPDYWVDNDVEPGSVEAKLADALRECPNVVSVKKGDKLDVFGITIDIVDANETGMMFVMEGVRDSMLFCMDAGVDKSELINTIIENKGIDYLQLSGHTELPVLLYRDEAFETVKVIFYDYMEGKNYWNNTIRCGDLDIDIYDFSDLGYMYFY